MVKQKSLGGGIVGRFACFLLLALFVAGIVFGGRSQAATGVNKTINFQGKLVNTDGTNITDGTYNMQFKIYQDGDGVSGGGDETLKWTEERLRNNSQGVTVTDGVFLVNLGSVTAFGSSVDWNQDTLWLSVNVGNTNASCTPFSNCSPDGEMSPFIRFTASPYALNANNLGGLAASNFVQLAQGVQTDSSTSNASIHINKTGGTANIIEIEKSGTDVFVINNSGNATFSGTVETNDYIAVGNNSSLDADRAINVTHTFDSNDDCATDFTFCHGVSSNVTANNPAGTSGIVYGFFSKVTTAAATFTLGETVGLQVGATSLGSGSTITSNYGIKIANQTAGSSDYGIYVAGADTNALWIDSGTSRFDGAINIIPESTGTYLDIALETEWTSGTLINADYASSTTQAGDMTGFNLNLNTNLTGEDDHDVTGVQVETPGFTGNATATTNQKGAYITGGSFDTSTAGATNLNWYGLDILGPASDTGHADDSSKVVGIRSIVPIPTDGAGTEVARSLELGWHTGATMCFTHTTFSIHIHFLDIDCDGSGGNDQFSIQNAEDETVMLNNNAFTLADGIELNIHSPATANTTALCWDNAGSSNVTDCNGAATDLAENFGTTEDGIEAGDLVAFDPKREANEVNVKDDYGQDNMTTKAWAVKTKQANDPNLIGVVSTNPNQLFGNDGVFSEDENPKPVTLSGRVPVKVNSENGNIKPGDYITASSIPGVGMKATGSAKVIGVALSSWENADTKTVGKIIVFVNPTHFNQGDASNSTTAGQVQGTVSTSEGNNHDGLAILDDRAVLLILATVSLGAAGRWLYARPRSFSYHTSH